MSLKKEQNKGGDAGEIFIAARNIQGYGKILATGGDGDMGGKGGKVTLITEDNQFRGEISAKGGKSTMKLKWYQRTLVQFLMLLGSLASIIGLIFYLAIR